MKIIGTGFIATHLERIAHQHDDVVALAAGVSFPTNPVESYVRERSLVESVVEECLRDDRKLVFMSSAAVYGRTDERGSEDEPPDPPTPYGHHKASLEALIRDSGVRHLSLRLGYVLGRDAPPHRLVPSLVRQVRAGTVTLHRHAYRDLLDVGDMVTITDGLLRNGVTDHVVNVASGQCVLIDRIVRHVERRLGMRAQWVRLDEGARHCMSTDKMLGLLPPDVELHFPPDYFRTVIDGYLRAVGIEVDADVDHASRPGVG
ncbi:NAD-dependent epimerase/dehydratase family protein [Nocardioides zeae]|uniref:NAD-dependent epimerase/dehydratase family protein n=1 Tax=Nocardioides zeae TaxID=1457234 RepID=A0A6P0HGH8_9ACTN|nr:NAD-dependent epimerase/dehydratase family protein [Nocardioides zeae]NEN77809.1 NAD-dependent epimerase/dehydratase family protein [Nocardioides zeae]